MINLSRPFIHRPVATTIIIFAVILFGVIAFRMLPVSELPNVDFPTILVTANLSGADAETMASTVATPLEKKLSSVAGIDNISSVSTDGSTRITMQFDLNRNIDAAAQDIQSALSQASRDLPKQMLTPPSYRKVNPADAPILYLALTGDNVKMTTLDDYAENYIAQRIAMISGVAEVNIYGPQQYAVRISINPAALSAKGLGLDTVRDAITALSTSQPSGTLQMDGRYHVIKTDGQLYNAAEFNQAIIAYSDNAPVYLKDVGEAQDSVANNKAATWYNSKRGIVLAVQRQPDANTVQVVKDIYALLPQLTQQLPGGAKLNISYDRSQFIKTSIDDMQYTLILAAILVALVMYLFLNCFASTVITLLALPVSILGTFGLMYISHYSLDNLSLMGLILAVGFVIDDAVVVLENIVRYVEGGIDRYTAALKGSSEIGFTIISMTISLIAVFIPILFMGGIIGRLFNEFAIVVSCAILLSGLVSLIFTPMLCSRFLPSQKEQAKHSHRFLDWFYERRHQYEAALRWCVQHQKFVFIPAIITFLLTFLLFIFVPKGFIPTEDTGLIRGATQAAEGTPYPDFVARQRQAANIIEHNPNVASVVSTVGQGAGGVASTTTGQFTIRLKPENQRSVNADEVIQELRPKLKQIVGLNVYLQNPPMIKIGAASTPSNYQYVLQAMNGDTLIQVSKKFQQNLRSISGIQDLNSDLQLNNPELNIHILRDQAAALGVTPEAIENTLYLAYGSSQIGSIITSTGNYEIIMEISPAYQHTLADLNALYVKSNSGAMVPLLSVVQIKQIAAPLSISHYGLLPAVTYSFNLRSDVSLDNVTKKINSLAAKTLPSTVTGGFIGAAQSFSNSLTTLPLLLVLSIIIIYMVLVILYEDFIQPLTILTALPFALFGGLLVLPLFGQQLNLYSFIGLIVLIGLVKKNGIMMVDFAIEAQRKQNLTPQEAIIEAAITRFRPIMMTTVAAIAAAVPLALGIGAGGDARRSLGIVMVGGLLFSQMFTLFVTPLFYLTMDKLSRKIHAYHSV